jgi:hypothetical protein
MNSVSKKNQHTHKTQKLETRPRTVLKLGAIGFGHELRPLYCKGLLRAQIRGLGEAEQILKPVACHRYAENTENKPKLVSCFTPKVSIAS